MSYVVLARKYRPRSFTEMVGQEHVVQALGNALTQQRLHHAYLFTGTRGVGKTTVSRILAKSLNCTGADGQGGITAEPCGQCAACRDIDAGRFVDYTELDAASNRGVDEISQLLDQAVYKPVVGRFKVYMIDEVHMLSTTAFNAMLKTLEEPPEYLKFVLATTDPQKVPVTVLSRCLQFNLRPMAPETVLTHLGHVLQQEGIAAEPGALRLLARGARGSMRDALSLTDQAIAFGAGRLEEAGVRQMLGATDRGHVVRLVEAIAAGDGAALVGTVDALRAQGLSAVGALEELMAVAQQMAVLQAVPAAADAADPETPVLQRLAGLLPADETQLMYAIALHGRAELALAPDEYSGLVMVLLRLLAFRGGSPAGTSAGTGVGAVASASAGAPAAQNAAPVAAPASAGLAVTPASAAMAVPVAAPPVAPRTPAADPRAAATRPGPPLVDRAPPVNVASEASSRPAAERRAASAPDVPPWEDIPPEDPEPAPRAALPERAAAPSRPSEPPRRAMAAAPAVPPATHTPDEPSARAERGVGGPRGGIPRTEVPPDPSLTLNDAARALNDRWIATVATLVGEGRITALVRELAWQSQCIAHEDGEAGVRWVLRCDREILRQGQHRERLEGVLAELHGKPVNLELEGGAVSDSAARRDAVARARAQSSAEQIILDDPFVQQMLQQYRTARIVQGSIRPA
jgi:DNA polymerase-3 subunit gamma/tau